MATSFVATIEDGVVAVPSELRDDPRYQDGARLQLVPVDESLGALVRKDWRKLEGIFKDLSGDATEMKEREREWELAHDERKFGVARPEW